MKVPFLDLLASYREIQRDLDAAARRVLESGLYIGGPEVEQFEAEFASYCGATNCIAVANGLDALQLALVAEGVQPGDEVIVPAHTFIATWLAITECGAIPVPVDIDADTYNLDPTRVEGALTKRTKAIVPVHLYGQPSEIDVLYALAGKHGLVIVEDAAQAHGARWGGRRIGGHGSTAAWSFYPGKNLGAFGDAGAITTNDSRVASKLRLLRNYGSTARYVHEIQGRNSRLDPIQAAFLRVKLARLDDWNARRRNIAERYLAGIGGADVTLPVVRQMAEPAWHLFCVRHPRRDAFQTALRALGVETLIHYPLPPHLQTAYADPVFPVRSFAVAESTASTILSLPIGPAMSDEQTDWVVDSVLRAAKKI